MSDSISATPAKKMRSGSVNLDGDRGRLFYTIGLPQSGKSSAANAWVREAYQREGDLVVGPQIERPRVIVSGDDFRQATYQAEYWRQGESLVFALMDASVRALLSRGFDVLIDETSTTEQTLLRYYLIDFNAQAILIDTPEEVCAQRAIANGKDFLVQPIRQMARQKAALLKDWPAAIERVKAHILTRYPNDVVRGER
jgi:predicted kinase